MLCPLSSVSQKLYFGIFAVPILSVCCLSFCCISRPSFIPVISTVMCAVPLLKFSDCRGKLKDCVQVGVCGSEFAKVRPCGDSRRDCVVFCFHRWRSFLCRLCSRVFSPLLNYPSCCFQGRAACCLSLTLDPFFLGVCLWCHSWKLLCILKIITIFIIFLVVLFCLFVCFFSPFSPSTI